MKKIRLTRVIICEYEPKMKYYPNGTTLEQAARLDAKDWKEKNIDVEDDIVSDNVIGEILDTEGTKKIVSECLWVE